MHIIEAGGKSGFIKGEVVKFEYTAKWYIKIIKYVVMVKFEYTAKWYKKIIKYVVMVKFEYTAKWYKKL